MLEALGVCSALEQLCQRRALIAPRPLSEEHIAHVGKVFAVEGLEQVLACLRACLAFQGMPELLMSPERVPHLWEVTYDCGP